jgi:hypothetical protein
MTARLMASDFRQSPGPEVVVRARFPANDAPMAAQMAAISSSAWKVRTPKCFRAASSWRMSEAGVMG